MKIRVTTTIDIDPESWDMLYGTGDDPTEIRRDVQAAARENLYQHFLDVGVIKQD